MHHANMQEVLSKSADPRAPVDGQEFYVLSLEDSDDLWRGRHIVSESHAHWDEESGGIAWDDTETEYVATLEAAKDRYEDRRAALRKRGFLYSDLDL
jgi:hypothetical protein